MIHDVKLRVKTRLWSKMKLAAVWNFWDGEENLAESVEAIRAHVDFLGLVWSAKSVYGESRTHDDLVKIGKLCKSLKFDEVVRFEPLGTGQDGAAQKRNQAIDLAKVFECTHLFSIEPDEIFKQDQFAMVRAETAEYDYATTTAPCDMEMRGINGDVIFKRMAHYIPMIYRIEPGRRFRLYKGRGITFPVLAESSRKLETHNKNLRRNYMADEVLILNRQANRETLEAYERSVRNNFYNRETSG